MIWNIMFSNEWSGSLKCKDTGVSLLTRVSHICSAILNLNSLSVSPTYCLAQFHIMFSLIPSDTNDPQGLMLR